MTRRKAQRMRRKRGWYVGKKRSKIVRMGGGRLRGGR